MGVGIKPNTENIGTENVGIQLDDRGFVKINEYMKTNIPGVYAVGDVTGKLPLAHVAFDQGVVAAETIANKESNPIEDYTDMPRCTYCQPQIASIGITEKEARELKIDYKIGKVPFQVAGMVKFLEGTNFELHKLTHAHPTLSEAIKEAGAAVTGEAIHF